MDKPTSEQIREFHDCSNCRFSKQVAPYKVILECEIDMETKIQPYTCKNWAGGQKVAKAQLDKLLNTVIVEAEVCPECSGEGRLEGFDKDFGEETTFRSEPCASCNGTGRTQPKTILDLIKGE